MKIQCVSDLHLEFQPRPVTNAGADILILSGDICVADTLKRPPASTKFAKGEEFRDFFKQVSSEFAQVFYVLGNHEHYHGRFQSTADIIRNQLPANITLLDNEFVDYEGYRIIGGTLWTDFDRSDINKFTVEQGLNDYRIIQWAAGGYRRLRGGDTANIHEKTKQFIANNVKGDTIVITHHAPSWKSIHARFIEGRYANLNSGYVSNLDNFILDFPEIKLWTHGHVHNNMDYLIGDTRVFCNPGGYGDENPEFNPNLIIEI